MSKTGRQVKADAVELLRTQWFAVVQQLEAYRLQNGPQSWGDWPTDGRAARLVGQRDGLYKAMQAMEKLRVSK